MRDCTHHTSCLLYSYNLTLKTKQPIASGKCSPPDPLLQRSTTGFSPLPQNILDPPVQNIYVHIDSLLSACIVLCVTHNFDKLDNNETIPMVNSYLHKHLVSIDLVLLKLRYKLFSKFNAK